VLGDIDDLGVAFGPVQLFMASPPGNRAAAFGLLHCLEACPLRTIIEGPPRWSRLRNPCASGVVSRVANGSRPMRRSLQLRPPWGRPERGELC